MLSEVEAPQRFDTMLDIACALRLRSGDKNENKKYSRRFCRLSR